jgi:hypothetical protein
MNTQLHYIVAQQRGAEPQRAGEQARLTSEVSARHRQGSALPPTARSEVAQALQHRKRAVGGTRFTLHGHHIAKLDRFVSQAQRAALRAEREFEGVSIELGDPGAVSVHAIGMTSMVL